MIMFALQDQLVTQVVVEDAEATVDHLQMQVTTDTHFPLTKTTGILLLPYAKAEVARLLPIEEDAFVFNLSQIDYYALGNNYISTQLMHALYMSGFLEAMSMLPEVKDPHQELTPMQVHMLSKLVLRKVREFARGAVPSFDLGG